jgi:hypothetical protein
MTGGLMEEQRREWLALYRQIREILQQFGEEDEYLEEKDYHLVYDNLGLWQHKIETSNLEMVRPVVIESLRKLLVGYPNWEIVIAVSNSEKAWPPMGLVIHDDEIIDGLQRQYFPREFQTMEYKGSRPQGSQFGDVMYSGPWRF